MNTYRVLLRTDGEEDAPRVYLSSLARVTTYLRECTLWEEPALRKNLLVEKVEITIDPDTYGVTLDYLYVKLLPVKAWTVTQTCRLKPCPLVVRERYMTGYPAPTSQQGKY